MFCCGHDDLTELTELINISGLHIRTVCEICNEKLCAAVESRRYLDERRRNQGDPHGITLQEKNSDLLQLSLQVKCYHIDRFNATDAQLSPQVRRVRKTERRVRPVTKPKTRSSYHLSTFLIVGEVTMGEGLK